MKDTKNAEDYERAAETAGRAILDASRLAATYDRYCKNAEAGVDPVRPITPERYADLRRAYNVLADAYLGVHMALTKAGAAL